MKTLAIDQGTTTTRALIVDENGNVEPLLSLPHRQIYPKSGWVEHDPEELIVNLGRCFEAAGEIEGVGAAGLANQGESCIAWDADTGEALGPVIVWQDDRTRTATDQLRADGAEDMVRERSGLPLDPYFSASKLAWLIRENPRARHCLEHGRLRLGTTDAFFLDRLTGRFATDVTTASRTSLMNIATCDWDDELCRLFGVPRETLPPIVPTTGDFGGVPCGDRSLPLAASIVDQQASLYGHGCRVAGDTKITFGTGAFALTVTDGLKRTDARGPLATIAWQKGGESPVHALDGGVYCAGSAVNWARHLGLFQRFEEIDAFDHPPAIGRGLAFVPALAGLACPHWDRAARGTWLGLSLDTTSADMMQAVLEGVALRIGEVVAAIETGQSISDPVAIDGGMTANPYFCQFLAAVLERDIMISDQPELTAIGAAALAAEAGERPFPLQRRGKRIAPRPLPAGNRQTFAAARAAIEAFGAAGRN